jgi:hypothetical protein
MLKLLLKLTAWTIGIIAAICIVPIAVVTTIIAVTQPSQHAILKVALILGLAWFGAKVVLGRV